jgi:hypothetical protein
MSKTNHKPTNSIHEQKQPYTIKLTKTWAKPPNSIHEQNQP